MNDHTSRTLASPWVWAVPVLSAIAFLLVWMLGVNQQLFLSLNNWGQSSVATVFWANATILGDAMMAFSLTALLVRYRPEVFWILLITAVIGTLYVQGFKHSIDIPRPGIVLANNPIHTIGVRLTNGSFPSGHTTTAFALAAVICMLRLHPVVSVSVVILAIFAGLSRAVVGAHWPLDIFAGAFGGWLSAVASIALFNLMSGKSRWWQHLIWQALSNIGILIIAISLFTYNSGYPDAMQFQLAVAVVGVFASVGNLWSLARQAWRQRGE